MSPLHLPLQTIFQDRHIYTILANVQNLSSNIKWHALVQNV